MRFKNVCQVGAQSYDLMITNTSEYISHKNSKTFARKGLAEINMESGTHVDLLFRILESGTMKRMPVESLIFSVLDMDDGPFNQTEQITLGNFSSVHMTSDTEVVRYINADGTSTFSATQYGEERDNPGEAEKLNIMQKRRALSFLYNNVSQWQVTLNVTGPEDGSGRNFLFTGESSLMLDCPISVKKTVHAEQ